MLSIFIIILTRPRRDTKHHFKIVSRQDTVSRLNRTDYRHIHCGLKMYAAIEYLRNDTR